MQTIHTSTLYIYSQKKHTTPQCLDKALSLMQVHDNHWQQGRKTRKKGEGEKKEG